MYAELTAQITDEHRRNEPAGNKGRVRRMQVDVAG
jgi:hypothetical protein